MTYGVFGNDIVVRLNIGEEILQSLTQVITEQNITCASISGIGACDQVDVCIYNVSEKKYYPNHYNKPMEMISLCGNATTMDGKPYLHLHAVFADETGAAVGGHLKQGDICATAELIIHKIAANVDRFYHPETGLNLLQL